MNLYHSLAQVAKAAALSSASFCALEPHRAEAQLNNAAFNGQWRQSVEVGEWSSEKIVSDKAHTIPEHIWYNV